MLYTGSSGVIAFVVKDSLYSVQIPSCNRVELLLFGNINWFVQGMLGVGFHIQNVG